MNIPDDKCLCANSEVDYYKALSLEKDCNELDIIEAYRQCAILYNPMQRKDEDSEAIFALAAEAYDVLSDPLRKAVYDQYGEKGLKNGVLEPEGFVEPYIYHGEPMKTFRWSKRHCS